LLLNKLQILLATYFVYAKAGQGVSDAVSFNQNRSMLYKLASMTTNAETAKNNHE
jgi:hypothetical protein